MPITFPNSWVSRAYQDPFFHAMGSGMRRALLIWHRRGGKDISAWNWTVAEAMRKTGVYYYFFPTFAQGRKAWWDGMDKQGRKYLDYIPIPESKLKKNDAEMKITFPKIAGGSNGSIIQIVGTDNYDSLMGTNPIGCVFSEYALQNPGAWKFIRPILQENGGWAVFVTTPRGPNHAKKLYDYAKLSDKWYTSLLSIRDTNAVSMDIIEEERAEGEDEAVIQQEWFCSWLGAQQGSYYVEQMRRIMEQGRSGDVPYDHRYPVYVFADIGHGDHTVLGFVQFVGDMVHFINCIGKNQRDLPYFAAEINRLAREEGYVYGGFYWPHDMDHKEWGVGLTRVAQARRLGLNPSRVGKKLSFNDGVNNTRAMLSRCRFDETKCEDLLSALWTYRKEFDEENKIFKPTPVHDWASHYADMVRLCAMTRKPSNELPGYRGRIVEAPSAIYTRDPLTGDYEQSRPTWADTESAIH